MIGPLLVAGFLGGLAIGIGFVLLIVPGLFLLTIWALIAPVIVIERKGAIESFGRSRALVQRSRLAGVRGAGGAAPAQARARARVVAAILIAIADSVVGYVAADLITNVLIAPLSALAAAVIYFELRRLHGETDLPRDSRLHAAGHRAPAPRLPAHRAPRPERHTRTMRVRVLADRPQRRRRPRRVRRGGARGRPRAGGMGPDERLRRPSSSGVDAAMVFGGAMHVDQEERHPWLRGEKELLRELLEPRRAGARGLPRRSAAGRGGRWRRRGRASEPEIGWTAVELTAGGPSTIRCSRAPSARFEAFEWHSYEAPLPDGAVALARSPVCLQAYRLNGARCLGDPVPRRGHRARRRRAGSTPRTATRTRCASGSTPRRCARRAPTRIDAWNELGRGIARRLPRGGRARPESLGRDVGAARCRRPP